MIVECTKCQRQYDVGNMAPGAKFLCQCATRVVVPEQGVQQRLMAKCSTCGAALAPGARSCAYCTSVISFEDHQLGDACPRCLARMLKGAHFCSACGTQIDAEVVTEASDLAGCPRCETKTLIARDVEMGRLVECTTCSGIWLAAKDLEKLIASHRESSEPTDNPPAPPQVGMRDVREEARSVKYLKCPKCENFMHRENFGRASGIIIDSCHAHGYWLDAFELESVLRFVQQGGLARGRAMESSESAWQAKQRASLPKLEPSWTHSGTSTGVYGSEGPDVLELVLKGVWSLIK
jgi:Zn-finger nucleic acid-binding protein